MTSRDPASYLPVNPALKLILSPSPNIANPLFQPSFPAENQDIVLPEVNPGPEPFTLPVQDVSQQEPVLP